VIFYVHLVLDFIFFYLLVISYYFGLVLQLFMTFFAVHGSHFVSQLLLVLMP